MADLLKLVREYFSNKKEIVERGDQVILGEFSWNKNAKTNVLIWGSGKNGAPKAYHTLADIVFFLKKIDLFHLDYTREATAANMQIVRRPMRKDMLAYFKGTINICPFIDPNGPREKPTQVIGQGSLTKQNEKSNSVRSETNRNQSERAGPTHSPSYFSLQDQVTPNCAQSNIGSLQQQRLTRQPPNSGYQQPPPNRNAPSSQTQQAPRLEQTDTERIQLSPISDQSSYDEFIGESPPSKRKKLSKTASLRNNSKALDTSDQDNQYNIFGRHVACELNKMSERQAIIAQEQIQSIISRCRLDNLNT